MKETHNNNINVNRFDGTLYLINEKKISTSIKIA